jgi:hypothetical protein
MIYDSKIGKNLDLCQRTVLKQIETRTTAVTLAPNLLRQEAKLAIEAGTRG